MSDTRIPIFNADGQTAYIDYRTESTNGDGRQVVVFGDPSINSNVASVQGSDPSSNTQGIVVRDVNTSAIAGFLGSTLGVYLSATSGTLNVALKPGTIAVSLDPGHLLGSVTANQGGTYAVYFDQSNPSVKANAGTGSFTVQFDPGHTLGLIDSINKTVNVQLDPGHTIGNIGTIGSITGSVAVYFDRANPSVSATFTSASLEVVPTTGSRKITDDANAALRVLVVGSQTAASLTVNGTVTANAGTGSMTVQLDPGHTLGKVEPGVGTFQVFLPDTGHELGSIRGITNSINAYIGSTAGTLQVKTDPSSVIQISNAPSITGITNSINVYVGATAGTLQVALKSGTIAVSLDPGYTLGKVDAGLGTFNVQLDPGHTLGNIGTVSSITNTVAVQFSPSTPSVDTELPAAAALADTASNPTVPAVGGYNMLFNGTSWDRARDIQGDSAGVTGIQAVGTVGFNEFNYDRLRNNVELTFLSSASRTTTQTQGDQTNYNSKGVKVTLDVTTPGSGSITLSIQGKDSTSGKYYTILSGAAVTTTTTNVYTVYPGLTAAANSVANDIIPRIYRIVVTHNNANAITYSVGWNLIL